MSVICSVMLASVLTNLIPACVFSVFASNYYAATVSGDRDG